MDKERAVEKLRGALAKRLFAPVPEPSQGELRSFRQGAYTGLVIGGIWGAVILKIVEDWLI